MRTDVVQPVLDDIGCVAGVEAVLLSFRDGLLLATSDGTSDRNSTELRAALTAAAFSAVDRAISQFGIGSAETISIETESHTLYVSEFEGYLLGVVTNRGANANVIRRMMSVAIDRFNGLVATGHLARNTRHGGFRA